MKLTVRTSTVAAVLFATLAWPLLASAQIQGDPESQTETARQSQVPATPLQPPSSGTLYYDTPRHFERLTITNNYAYGPRDRDFSDVGATRPGQPFQRADYQVQNDLSVSLGATVMVTQDWGVGGSIEDLSWGTLDTQLRLQGVDDGATITTRDELAGDIDVTRVLWRNAEDTKLLRVSGGPTYFHTSQSLVSAIVADPDCGTATDDGQISEGSSGWGWHAGADFSAYAKPAGEASIGWGLNVRYASAPSTDFVSGLDPGQPSDSNSNGIGGWEFGAGIRFRY
jgi:hypothetical protein